MTGSRGSVQLTLTAFLVLLAFAPAASAAVTERPHFETRGEQRTLMVDGRPFLVLAAQADVWSMQNLDAGSAKQFEIAASMNCNTIEVPLRWAQVEPSMGAYTMAPVDWILARAREHGLRLVLLWFGSNVCGKAREVDGSGGFTGPAYAPDYVFNNPARYERVLDASGTVHGALSPEDPDTLARETAVFRKVNEHLRKVDARHTVIMWQVLNEVSVTQFGRATLQRDHSAASNRRYKSEGWKDPVRFTITQFANYIGDLTKVVAETIDIPCYINIYEDHPGVDPEVEIYLNKIPEVAFVAPDIYQFGRPRGKFKKFPGRYRKFRSGFLTRMDGFQWGRNVVYLSELTTDSYWRPDLSLFYILGKYSGSGFVLWAITKTMPPSYEALFNPRTQRLTTAGTIMQATYGAVGKAMEVISEAQGTDRFAWFVSEKGGRSEHRLQNNTVVVDSDVEGAGLIAETGTRDVTIVGKGCRAKVKTAGWSAPQVETGSWNAGQWKSAGSMSNAPTVGWIEIPFGGPQAVRVFDGN